LLLGLIVRATGNLTRLLGQEVRNEVFAGTLESLEYWSFFVCASRMVALKEITEEDF
jgi:hypothetical protein